MMDTAVCAPPADPHAPRWSDWLLGDVHDQRLWLARLLRVGALFLALDLGRAVGVGLGLVPLQDMAALLAYNLGVLGVGYGLIRSGWSARLDDPSLTMPLVGLALISIVLGYVWVDVGRGALLPLAAVVLVHGMHRLTPRQTLAWAGALLVVLSMAAAVMALLSLQGLNLAQEAIDLGVAALGLPVLAAVAGRAHAVLQTHARQRAELRQSLARLEALTTKDALTGLSNHRHMLHLLDVEILRHSRQGRVFSVALLDVDHFEQINEALGRARADEVLRQLAHVSTTHLRASDVMGRWGGEEFILLMPETDLAGGVRSMERLKEKLYTKLGFYREGRWVPVNCSAGVTRHHTGETIHQTLARAEQALRSAKANGRNQVVSS
jgi:diguanylate cyclase (GGDEF)-like protein